MTKKLYIASAAGGKTSFVLDLARQTAASLTAEVRVCVPTGLQAQAWRARLELAGGAIGVHVLTFDRLVAACLDAAGENYTELSDPVLYRLLRSIINNLSLTHYAPLKAKPGFIQVARQVITELKSALILPEAFQNAVVAMGNEARLRELAEIYIAYQDQLQNENWADRVGLHWLAVESLAIRAPGCCADWSMLIVDGFDDFTPSQLALLKLLANRVGQFVLTLPEEGAAKYPRYQNTRRDVEKALNITGETMPTAKQAQAHPVLHHLARQIFNLSSPEVVDGADALVMREAADRVAETRSALRWLKQRIVLDGLPAHKVALLARDLTPYRAFIRQIAGEFGLPIRLVDGIPLWQSPVINALLALLRLFLPVAPTGEPSLPRRQVIAAWRSPYFAWKNSDLKITLSDADFLDKFAREQRVIRGFSQWQAAFAAGLNKDKQVFFEEEEGSVQMLAGTVVSELKNKFAYFMRLTQPPETKMTMRGFVAWLEELIGPDPDGPGSNSTVPDSLNITLQAKANPETAAADVAALRALKDLLRGFVWAEASVTGSAPVDFLTFFNELSGAIAATHFLLPTQKNQEEILVAEVLAVRGLSFAAVAVMGLSEGSFPATISEDPFLRDEDRALLRQNFAYNLRPSTQSAEREFFYEAITRSQQKLLLTRPVLAENGAEWVASPFWEAVQQLVNVDVELIPSEYLLTQQEAASEVEWLEAIAAHEGRLVQALDADKLVWQRINTAAHIWKARSGTLPSIWNGGLTFLAEDLKEKFGPETTWSATRLESYQACGFLFYTQHVLKLAPRPEPAEGLDTSQVGSLYHRIFERVTQAQGPDQANVNQVRQVVLEQATPILDAAPEHEGFRETPWWNYTRHEIIDNVIASVLALAEGEFEFYQAERRFGIADEAPLLITNGDDKLKVRGFIDRLDRDRLGRLRIVDYKLAGPWTYNARAFREGMKLQLPLYALAAQEALGLGEVAEGFYWHYKQAQPSPFQLGKADGGVQGAVDTAIAHAWDAVYRIREGQFNPQPPDGGCPSYCPAAAFCWQYSPRNY